MDDEPIDIRVHFISRTIFVKSVESDGYILKGKCKYEAERCTVKVDKKADKIFDGQYDTIVFIKHGLDEIETE